MPSTIYGGTRNTPELWPKEPLAYVEWYSPLKSAANSDSLMYTVSNMPLRPDGICVGQVIPLTHIRQSCQLIPHFGTSSPRETWTSDNILDMVDRFYLNNWASLYTYQTLW